MTDLSAIDLHMHTTVSDGTDTPEAVISVIKEAGLRVFAVTDHDDLTGCAVIRGLLTGDDPAFINGVEFSCTDEDGKYHILGYGYDQEGAGINALARKTHEIRMKKARKRIELLESRFGFTFPDNEIKELLRLNNPGKPHIGNLMVKYGFAESKEDAMRSYINKLKVEYGNIRPEEAISEILESGGTPVLAHPFYGSGDDLIIGDEMEARLKKLKGYGLQGVEAFYSGFTDKLSGDMLEYAEKYDFYVTAGSDYHGTNKLIDPGDTNYRSTENGDRRMRAFLEKVTADAE